MSFHPAGWVRLSPGIAGAIAAARKRPAAAAFLLLLGISLALCYGSTFAALAAEWSRSDTYSYGYLVPWISLYLAWTQRDKLRATRLAPNWPAGAALVGVGLAAKVIGFAGGATVIEGLSLIPVLAGALLLFGGVGLLRALLLPVLYLLFMVPVWEVLIGRVSPHFQLFSAWLGIGILKVIGVPAVREGFFIHLPGMTLHVAEACSGVNYLIAVTAIGIPLAWISFSDWQRRVALVGLGVAVATLFNALRVALIGILLYAGLSHSTHGPGHVLQGLSVATMGYVALFLIAWALSRHGPERRSSAPDETLRAAGANPGLRVSPIRGAATLSIALVAVFAWESAFRPTPMPLTRPLSEFPLQLGSWRGGEGIPGAIALVAIPGSDRLERVYSSPSGFAASVAVLYVADQSGARDLVGYRTTPLLRGRVVYVRSRVLGPVKIRRSETREEGYTNVTFAWYDIGGHVTPSPMNAKLRTAWHVLSRGTSNGALVAIRAEYSPDEAAAREPELRAFVELLLDSLGPALRGRRSVST